MSKEILNAVQNCSWSPSKFFIISENVFEPLIYYSHLGALIIALSFGMFVYLNNRKAVLNKLLLLLSLAISLWLFADMVLWASDKMYEVMFFWSLEIIVEPLIYVLALFFFYVFVDKKIPYRARALAYILLVPSLILAWTNYGLTGFDLTNCDRVAVEGWLPKYGYVVETLIVLWIVFIAFDRYSKNTDPKIKNQIALTAIGVCLFLFSFSLGNIAEVITENWYIGQIGYIGIPIFIAFLSYQIVKFKTFNIKLVGPQVLVAAIWFLILSTLFIRTIENSRVVIALTLALFSVLGILLIRSVKRETQQRERIQKLADDLERANEKLTELDKMKSEFLSLATHQIRSPLTAIKGYSSMLAEGDFGKLPKKASDASSIIMKSCQNLINIVEDFLNISRIEQGRMVYESSVFDIKELVEETINEIRPNIEKAGLDLEIKMGEEKIMVNVDRGKIKQAIGNIIDNAIKYTPKGSIEISVSKSGGMAKVSVKDSGVGIDPLEIDKLFIKFSRTKDASKTNVSGTGLGLYIAKKMIEASGGSIEVMSSGREEGTTFTVELPQYHQ